ncbi:hypothetical protein [Jiangella rhizosphaerae]|uniref:Uncharacterized protein n=1 Tax=Jiangella rhizosphaerae TaxID=2293569 RepID=A0A418KJG2_9ACTN|nr:hypothetical protein [Jiangella rhizosphaerae]RIQ14406.1 hypothetical protein DY240_24900 [Jiangella rhizosphaerae]
MGFFRRREDDQPQPSAFVADICHRLGEGYGGFDTVTPLPPGSGGPGAEVVIHVVGSADPDRPPFLRGTGIVRTARAYPDRTEVFDGDALLAVYDDLTVTDVFGAQ